MKRVFALLMALCAAIQTTAFAANAPFSDVPEDAWYASAVRWCAENGLMNGIGGGKFSPDADVSRAMAAAVLYRAAGSPLITRTALPPDVSDSAWYRDAAAWALESGVLSAAGGRFAGDAAISRETLAQALWISVGRPAAGTAAPYADAAQIQNKDAAAWARSVGLMNGVNGNRFAPNTYTSRAMLATILQRLDSLGETGRETMLTMKINGTPVAVDWADNESVTALRERVGKGTITVETSMYGGFEQVGSLGASLPRNDVQTRTEPGDIVLYSGNQIVVFYGSNTWAYTRLGKIRDMSAQELKKLLGNDGVTLTISLD